MLTALNDFILNFMDVILGWMLHLPQGVVLIVVGVGTSAILTFTRPFVTNQNLLKRCKDDKKRLKQLICEAKESRDKEAIKRHRASIAGIGMKTMRAEVKPLLLAIVPIALLAVWAFSRLAFVPAVGGETIDVAVFFRATSIDKVAQMVPVDGLDVSGEGASWVRRVVEDPKVAADGKTNGMATWTLTATQRDEPYVLVIRHGGQTVKKELLVDGVRYSPTIEVYEGGPIQAVELKLKSYKPFGIVPGIPWLDWESDAQFPWLRVYAEQPPLCVDPWLVGYLVICVPFVFVLRRLCHIY